MKGNPRYDKYFRRVDPEFIRKITPFLDGLYRHYFRCEITGWENVPKKKALLVGNHNGMLVFEVFMLMHAWRQRFGVKRKVFGLAHGIALNHAAFRWLTRRVGAIPANPKIGRDAFRRGHSVLVYPGGEKESLRPYSERKKIDFYGRKGFLRLALKARVPILPIVSIGAHETYVILHRGEEIAEKLGLKKSLRLHGFPITFRTVFFMWCVVTGVFTGFPLLLAPFALLFAAIPLPAKMTFRILEPIDVCSMVDPLLSEEENLQVIYDHILWVMRCVHDEEYAKRKLPVMG